MTRTNVIISTGSETIVSRMLSPLNKWLYRSRERARNSLRSHSRVSAVQTGKETHYKYLNSDYYLPDVCLFVRSRYWITILYSPFSSFFIMVMLSYICGWRSPVMEICRLGRTISDCKVIPGLSGPCSVVIKRCMNWSAGDQLQTVCENLVWLYRLADHLV